jgi:hypothetical protein
MRKHQPLESARQAIGRTGVELAKKWHILQPLMHNEEELVRAMQG